MICDNITTGTNGHLFFAGQDTVELAKQYGTPVYLMDEDKIREKCRIYIEAFRKFFPEGSQPLYASKACSFKHIYRIPEPDKLLAEIQRRKDLISQGIVHILSTQKLQQRTCPSCKRHLPWNWPYRLCDSCYGRGRKW